MAADPDDDPLPTMQMKSGAPDTAPSVMVTIRATDGEPPTVAPPGIPPPRYELGEEIARGGMGRVIDAVDTLLGRTVALKEALALDAESLRRFAREIQITARHEHPAIVPVHDTGTMAGGAPFYVMRKIGGRPLERLVASAETLGERLALIPHVIATAQAVAHAHERGIIHRDIKPSNILCGELGETIVIDWGLAKVKGEPDDETGTANWVIEQDDLLKTRAGIVFGTPGFMAPEQLRGNHVNERTDVYALGATLYHLLSRKPPHHAKTADDMMRAAVKSPPVPLDELVTGVPPELTTIVDKALAYDPKTRYQDAKALADDLQRFLTGQLVASHHYTTREKLARFIKKNRVPVLVAAFAALALAIVGVIAVTRVIGERDRADNEARNAKQEQAKAETSQRRAEERNEKLVLQQARSKVTSNPTEAIAMIKPLAKTQWLEVRSIAAAAQVGGIAWSLPGPRHTETLEMSRDGLRVLVAGDDGSVRIYDLVARTQHVLIEHGPRVRARFADSEREVVTYRGDQLSVLDAATGARRAEVTVPSKIIDLEIIGVNAYWCDDAKKLWHLDLAGKNPIEIPVDERIDQVAPSPDGRWIALVGENHLLLHDRTQPTLPAQDLLFGKVKDLDWSDDGAHLAALIELGEATERQVADVAVASGGQVVHRARVGLRSFVAWSQDRMFTIGPMGVGVASRSETTPRKQLVGEAVGLRESAAGVVVAASQGGLAILTDDGDHTVPLPNGRLDIIDASARSPYVVGMIEGRILVWNLAEMLPRQLSVRAATIEAFTGNDRILAAYVDTTAEWIDLATKKTRALGSWASSVLSVGSSPDGRTVCIVDATHHASLVVDPPDPTHREPESLGQADLCLFAGGKLIRGTLAGTLTSLDLASRETTTLITRAQKLVHVTASRGSAWLAASFADGTLWRVNLASGLQATTPAGGIPPMILVQRDGTVVFPEGRALKSWRPTGEIQPLVELGKPVIALGVAGTDHALVFVEGGSGYTVRLDVPNSRSEPFELPGVSAAIQSPDTGILVFANRGAIEVLDPLGSHRWTIAASPGLTYTSPLISGDGKTILARRVVTDREKRDVENREQTALLAWRFAMPASPDETDAWLRHLTNATVDPQTSNLAWP